MPRANRVDASLGRLGVSSIAGTAVDDGVRRHGCSHGPRPWNGIATVYARPILPATKLLGLAAPVLLAHAGAGDGSRGERQVGGRATPIGLGTVRLVTKDQTE